MDLTASMIVDFPKLISLTIRLEPGCMASFRNEHVGFWISHCQALRFISLLSPLSGEKSCWVRYTDDIWAQSTKARGSSTHMIGTFRGVTFQQSDGEVETKQGGVGSSDDMHFLQDVDVVKAMYEGFQKYVSPIE